MRAVIETTNLERRARLLDGEQRAAELMAATANLQAGLALVAEAELDGVDEPDFLAPDGAE